jgi:hypothetical protein
LWATVAYAFFRTNDPMAALGDLKFASTPKVIDGLRTKV